MKWLYTSIVKLIKYQHIQVVEPIQQLQNLIRSEVSVKSATKSLAECDEKEKKKAREIEDLQKSH